jgi:hypothetical protein
MGSSVSDEVANHIASRFIARKDVKAVQFQDGSWAPHTDTGRRDGKRLPWKRSDLLAHLQSRATFGHYLLSTENQCKLFAFDVDLDQAEPDKDIWQHWEDTDSVLYPFDARQAWQDRAHPARPYMKLQFKELAHKLLRGIYENLGIPCAVAYSGGKGIHVYGFTGLMSAEDVRSGAEIVLDSIGGFTSTRGTNFYKHENYPNMTTEIFPKQTNLNGKDLGNLMRLPLGRNLKSSDPTFFVDMTTPMGQMAPVDSLWALTTANPWKKPGE